MDKPKRQRLNRTSITRSRTGCYTCRSRRKKCDEAKPSCQQCLRVGLQCEAYEGPRISFMDTTAQVAKRSQMIEARKWDAIREKDRAQELKRKRPMSPSTNDRPEEAFTGSSHSLSPMLAQEPSQSGGQVASNDALGEFRSPANNFELALSETLDISIDEGWPDLDQSNLNVASPSLLLSLSPLDSTCQLPLIPSNWSHFSRDDEYLSYFHTSASGSVHSSLAENASALSTVPGLKNAMLAISASELAYAASIIDLGDNEAVSLLSKDHLKVAFEYYDATIQALSKPVTEVSSELTERLTAIILCTIFECRMGSPRGFISHMVGADTLVLNQHAKISQTTSGRKVLGVWSHLRALLKLNRLPFRPAEEERITRRSRLCHSLEQVYCDGRSGAIQAMLSNAYTLRRRIVMQSHMGCEDALLWYTLKSGDNYLMEEEIRDDMNELDINQINRLLRQQQKELDEWHENLDLVDLPREKATSATINGASLSNQSIIVRAFHFDTTRSAIQYLSYALAQLLCFEEPLSHRQNHHGNCPIYEWTHMALRIIQSIDLTILNPGNLSINFCMVIYILISCNPSLELINYLLKEYFPQLKIGGCKGMLLAEIDAASRLLLLYENELLADRTPSMVTIFHSKDKNLIMLDEKEPLKAAVHGMTADGMYSNCVVVP